MSNDKEKLLQIMASLESDYAHGKISKETGNNSDSFDYSSISIYMKKINSYHPLANTYIYMYIAAATLVYVLTLFA